MPKQTRNPKFADDELRAMTPEQKLDRVKYLKDEIKAAKARRKDENAAHRDYINELDAQIEELMDSVEKRIPPEEGSVQAEMAARQAS